MCAMFPFASIALCGSQVPLMKVYVLVDMSASRPEGAVAGLRGQIVICLEEDHLRHSNVNDKSLCKHMYESFSVYILY